ncbi:hypothetical protein LCL61_29570 [Amycolatopsis coloradensis]|uniref:Uncharacterized protein n=1 Tax=Amycolatopsis coloradensis TaxID=76021 RepID=A0ACD5BKD6_9PSEU
MAGTVLNAVTHSIDLSRASSASAKRVIRFASARWSIRVPLGRPVEPDV